MDWGIFCELLSIKESQTNLQNKETAVQSYRKTSNQNTKKSPEIESALFNCAGKMRRDNFGCLNSSLFKILFLFCNKPAKKKFYGVRKLTAEPPPPPKTSQFAFSWTTLPPPCVRTLWMTLRDNSHSRESNIVTLSNNLFLTLCLLILNNSVIIKAISLPPCSTK